MSINSILLIKNKKNFPKINSQLKTKKKLFILSDGSSYSGLVISLKNYKDYILLNQDLNSHSFWFNK